MRLTGYACKHPEPPARQVFLPLGDLTVLLGPNDAGKSTLLRSLVRDLAGGHFGDDADTEHLIGGVFYGEVASTELQRIMLSVAPHGHRVEGSRPPFGEGLWTTKATPKGLRAEGPQAVVADLTSRLSGEAVRPILEALAVSRTVAVECAGLDDHGQRVWNAYWCLDPIELLDAEVAAALRGSDLAPFKGSDSRGWRRMYEATYGQPLHLYADAAPVAVVSLGATMAVGMPHGLGVPATYETLQASVSEGITAAVNVWRHAHNDAQREGEHLSNAEEEERRAPRAWLGTQDGWIGVSWEAIHVFEFLSASANRLLPDFVSARYRVGIELRDVDEWFTSEPLRLFAWRPRPEAPEDFPIERVADGFRIWMQLAVLRSLDQIRAVASLMNSLASERYERNHAASRAPDETELEAELEAAADADRCFNAVADEVQRVDIDSGTWVSGELQQKLDALPNEAWPRENAGARRFLVVDEPERHLHPRLQRQAAAWLAQTAQVAGAPLLLATHSPAFLSLPSSDATYVSVSRIDDNARAVAFDPTELTQLDEMAQAMGYDRGELIGMVRVWLIVEGMTDKAVFTELYGNKLRREGIEVVPLHGTAKWQAVLDADALWRFTTAPVAVMFDGLDAEAIRQMLSESDADLAARERSAKERKEIKAMAPLIRSTRRIGRAVHPMPFEPADMLMALDEAAVKTVLPDYPGHQAVAERWQIHNKGSYDTFLKRYGVEKSEEQFGAIASAMVRADVTSAMLDGVIEACVALADGVA